MIESKNKIPSIGWASLGCPKALVDSERILTQLRAEGYDISPSYEGADLVVVNTCAVTAEAVRQARQTIRKARRENPEAQIIVTGCAAQIEPALFAAMPEVAHVIGNAEKTRADTWATLSRAPRVRVGPTDSLRGARAFAVDAIAGQTRAFLEVQNGCDHRCTFCIIPFGRGNSRSVPAAQVIEQVRRFVANGYSEIVLSGVDLTSWGADLDGAPRLGRLVAAILREVPELARLRLSSIDQIEADAELMAATDEREVVDHIVGLIQVRRFRRAGREVESPCHVDRHLTSKVRIHLDAEVDRIDCRLVAHRWRFAEDNARLHDASFGA